MLNPCAGRLPGSGTVFGVGERRTLLVVTLKAVPLGRVYVIDSGSDAAGGCSDIACKTTPLRPMAFGTTKSGSGPGEPVVF